MPDYSIDSLVYEYLRRLSSELGSSNYAQLLNCCAAIADPDRLARLVSLGTVAARLFAHCDPIHREVLFLRHSRRALKGGGYRFIGHADSKSCKLRGREIAAYLGLTYDQYRRVLTEANRRVRQAISEVDLGVDALAS